MHLRPIITLSFILFSGVQALAEESSQLKVVATTEMIADAAKQIGGDKLKVETLIKSGSDPHLYKLSSQDLDLLKEADIILFNGLTLEDKMLPSLSKYMEKKKAIAVSDRLEKNIILRSGQFNQQPDPHIWNDVSLWQKVVERIKDELVERDPKNTDDYKARAINYNGQLAGLHRYASTVIQTIPADQRAIVSAHDAFQYFGRAYDIGIRATHGVSTDSEANLKDTNVLVAFILERKIPAIFVESTMPKKNIEALVEGVRAKGEDVKIGGTLLSDALGEPGTRQGTYIGMFEANVNTIAQALGGHVPEKGFVTLEDIREQQGSH